MFFSWYHDILTSQRRWQNLHEIPSLAWTSWKVMCTNGGLQKKMLRHAVQVLPHTTPLDPWEPTNSSHEETHQLHTQWRSQPLSYSVATSPTSSSKNWWREISLAPPGLTWRILKDFPWFFLLEIRTRSGYTTKTKMVYFGDLVHGIIRIVLLKDYSMESSNCCQLPICQKICWVSTLLCNITAKYRSSHLTICRRWMRTSDNLYKGHFKHRNLFGWHKQHLPKSGKKIPIIPKTVSTKRKSKQKCGPEKKIFPKNHTPSTPHCTFFDLPQQNA